MICLSFCLIHVHKGTQLKAENWKKYELKDERTTKKSIFGKAVCGGNTGESGGFDHSAMKSEASSLKVVNWCTWPITFLHGCIFKGYCVCSLFSKIYSREFREF